MSQPTDTAINTWPDPNPFADLIQRRRMDGIPQSVIRAADLAELLDIEYSDVWQIVFLWINEKTIRYHIDVSRDIEEDVLSCKYWLTIPTALAVLVKLDTVDAWRLHCHLADLTVRTNSLN